MLTLSRLRVFASLEVVVLIFRTRGPGVGETEIGAAIETVYMNIYPQRHKGRLLEGVFVAGRGGRRRRG